MGCTTNHTFVHIPNSVSYFRWVIENFLDIIHKSLTMATKNVHYKSDLVDLVLRVIELKVGLDRSVLVYFELVLRFAIVDPRDSHFNQKDLLF